METFRTFIPPAKPPFSLTHDDHLVLLGSCFTEHFGERLLQSRFDVLVNPNGIVYNPVSIGQSLLRLLQQEPYAASDLFSLNGLWHSWAHHGHFSKPSPEEALREIDAAFCAAQAALARCTCLMLTLGAAQVHRLLENGAVVANNHKAPAAWFVQEMLSVGQCVEALAPALSALQVQRPGVQVLLTVSPVRHTRQGMVENQRSKATLVLACAELERQLPFVSYFPAYELLLDDLRDYRFYAADMIHPSAVAVDYIWAYFSQAFFPDDTRNLLHRFQRLHAAVQHRPFHPHTPAHRSFLEQQLNEVQALQALMPKLDFSAERRHFEQQLNA
ncbi:MAG: GSCFA domain-containing protein [Saprospiraceae bacterium]